MESSRQAPRVALGAYARAAAVLPLPPPQELSGAGVSFSFFVPGHRVSLGRARAMRALSLRGMPPLSLSLSLACFLAAPSPRERSSPRLAGPLRPPLLATPRPSACVCGDGTRPSPSPRHAAASLVGHGADVASTLLSGLLVHLEHTHGLLDLGGEGFG
mmetsp:Transcript_2962/g.7478  ORF Transcript_2962/g.7478 Transcript_2962/m.7478 type:complete len:159 (-) Transcript_2962:246-722(-)